MLDVDELRVAYGPVAAVRGVSLTCRPGEIVAIVGPNGAGKSTLLMAVAGALGSGVTGRVTLDARPLLGLSPEDRVRAGVALVPERRRIFASLTVRENLLVGMSARPRRSRARSEIASIEARFPILAERRNQPAGLLSGGEQQQLAIARALVAKPRILLLDEPSLGLAPLVIDEVFRIIRELRSDGLGILLVEQNAHRASSIADTTLLLRNGTIAARAAIEEAAAMDMYFGLESPVAGEER